MDKQVRHRGFTLIEILVVIAILGIMASIIIASLSDARNRADRAATLANMRGMMPELASCANDDGIAPTAALTSSLYMCATTTSGVNAFGAHTTKWLALSSGWTYSPNPTGSLVGADYQFSVAKAGQTTITCTFAQSKCQ